MPWIDAELYPYIGLIFLVWAISKFANWVFEVKQWSYDHPKRPRS